MFCVPVGLCAEVVLEIFEPVFGVIREGVVGGVVGCGVGGALVREWEVFWFCVVWWCVAALFSARSASAGSWGRC